MSITHDGDVHNAGPPSAVRPSRALENSKGFIAGVFSGITKLSGMWHVSNSSSPADPVLATLVGHPFDTIKVRLQTSGKERFRGPLHCLAETIKKEGPLALYKGASPPLIGWMFTDSVMLGSLTLYRRLLNENVFNSEAFHDHGAANTRATERLFSGPPQLPTIGHAIAGLGAGLTVSLIAAPIEHVKARLQVQYAKDKSKRLYTGPLDCTKKLLKNYGVRGLYRGLFAALHFRAYFFFWWGSYDLFSKWFHQYSSLSIPSINFWAGGFSASVFWLCGFPSDVVKQRIMTDRMGPDRRFPRWIDAARAIYRESGYRGYWRGFVPCLLRSFPANASALLAFESVMRALT